MRAPLPRVVHAPRRPWVRFSLNGAVRFKACDDMRCAPRGRRGCTIREKGDDGVMAPVLFRVHYYARFCWVLMCDARHGDACAT